MSSIYKNTTVKGRCISLHRLVWQQHYGEIPKGYVIHHKDGNKLNNDISNLELMESFVHLSHHFSGSKNPMYGVDRNGEKNTFYGKHHSQETKDKIRIAKTGFRLERFICPYCGKETGSRRWHGENCKHRSV